MTREGQLSNNNTGDRKSVRISTVTDSCPVAVSESPFQGDEGPLNGGGNSDPLKVA